MRRPSCCGTQGAGGIVAVVVGRKGCPRVCHRTEAASPGWGARGGANACSHPWVGVAVAKTVIVGVCLDEEF